ncbi:MAG: hypothetical protein Kow0047_21160 [Anaerolineae bacterium]
MGIDLIGAQRPYPTRRHPNNVAPGSLGAIVRLFKSTVTRRINALRDTPGVPVWRRSSWEHIIRTERALNAVRCCIADTPSRR